MRLAIKTKSEKFIPAAAGPTTGASRCPSLAQNCSRPDLRCAAYTNKTAHVSSMEHELE